MARTNIPVTTLDRIGTPAPSQTNADATNNMVLVNNGSTLLEIVSSDAAAQTVSFVLATSAIDGVAVPAKVVDVAAGATVYVGGFPTATYNQGAVAADATITSDATAPADGDTVTIASTVYTFKTTLTGTAYQVAIGGTAAAALANLKKAINASGVAGTDYGTGTAANTSVTGSTLTATTLLVVAITAGPAGNAVAVSETSAHLSWNGTTLSGGQAASTVLFVNPSVSTTLKFRAYAPTLT